MSVRDADLLHSVSGTRRGKEAFMTFVGDGPRVLSQTLTLNILVFLAVLLNYSLRVSRILNSKLVNVRPEFVRVKVSSNFKSCLVQL